jgi:hypothetical protein
MNDPQPSGPVSPGLEPVLQTPVLPTPVALPVEIGGRKGPEPTRFGDWEKDGRCIDF